MLIFLKSLNKRIDGWFKLVKGSFAFKTNESKVKLLAIDYKYKNDFCLVTA